MKLTLCSVIGLSLILASCKTLDPEYAEYKKQKEAQANANAQAPFGQNPDPFGVPATSPGSETGSYAPYQPLPGVNNPLPAAPEPISPLGSPIPGSSLPTIPSGPLAAPIPSAPSTSHQVVAKDSLWALAKRYNTSVDAIRAANGIPAGSSKILTGQTLQIPSP